MINPTEKYQQFVSLIKDNQAIIFKVIRSYTISKEDEEDLKQEILYQLWKSYDSFKGDSKFSTWMYRVAFNTAITFHRKEIKSIPTNELNDSLKIIDEENSQEQVNLLYHYIQKLNETERAIIIMYLDDLPQKEIAENMGISEINTRVKIGRIKQKLKNMIQNETSI